MALLNCSVDGLKYQYATNETSNLQTAQYSYNQLDQGGTLWSYWQNQYYPLVIKESYPVYIQEKAMDKGKQAFEILKSLMDKKLLKLDKVSDFVEAMDTILKTL